MAKKKEPKAPAVNPTNGKAKPTKKKSRGKGGQQPSHPYFSGRTLIQKSAVPCDLYERLSPEERDELLQGLLIAVPRGGGR